MREIKLDYSLILAIYALLFVFGVGYNHAIGWAEKRKYLEGFTSLAVVLGVLVVLLAVVPFTGWMLFLILLGAFGSAGAWMIGGSIWRYVRTRGEAHAEYVRQAQALAEHSEGSKGPGC